MSATKSARINPHRSFVRLTALTVVLAMPLMGMSGVASAKTTKATAAKCAKHPHRCAKGGGGGTGGAPANIYVSVSPNPLIETGQSEIHAIVQVQSSPAFAGDPVFIYSQQLVNSCEEESVLFYSSASGELSVPSGGFITAVLDDDGNATVELSGTDCAPGSSVIEADLVKAPYYTATTTLVANPPVPTTAGVTGYPNPEVETGDTTSGPNGPSGNSDVYAVFYVEESPVYAETPVEISSAQLQDRCGQGAVWSAGNGGTGDATGAQTLLDDDGNAVFIFEGASCAAGASTVIADVEGGTGDTFVTNYTVNPPAPYNTPPPPPVP